MSDKLAHLRTASRALKRAKEAAQARQNEVYGLIVALADEPNITQREIVEASGFTREHIRRIVDAARKKADDAATADA